MHKEFIKESAYKHPQTSGLNQNPADQKARVIFLGIRQKSHHDLAHTFYVQDKGFGFVFLAYVSTE